MNSLSEEQSEVQKDERKEKKIYFAGVNPDLLRATIPDPKNESPAPAATPKPAPEPAPFASLPEEDDFSFGKSERLTGQRVDAYGIQQGKEACLRSVLQRLRSGRMNPVEEAKAMIFLLQNQVVSSQAELAEAMGKPKSKVSEKLAILKLPRSVLLLIERHPEVITEGHAIELIRLKDPALVLNAAERVIEMKLTRDRLRTEIGFLLKKHGDQAPAKHRREGKSYLRYFPRVDGGFDMVYRFRPDSRAEDLERLIGDIEAKLLYLKGFCEEKRRRGDLTAVIAEDITEAMRNQREMRHLKPAAPVLGPFEPTEEPVAPPVKPLPV